MTKGKIDYDNVVAATNGDALAAGAVLDYFNDFMDGLCTGFYTDADGFWDYGSKPPSPLVFLPISTHFTATLGIPLTSPTL